MIQSGSIVKIVDNSGAKTAKCVKVLKGYQNRVAKEGDVIIVSIQSLVLETPNLFLKKISKLQNKDLFKALVIRTKNNINKKQNIKYKFKSNCVALIDKQDNPVGTRIFGFISKNIKKKYNKFVAISLKKF